MVVNSQRRTPKDHLKLNKEPVQNNIVHSSLLLSIRISTWLSEIRRQNCSILAPENSKIFSSQFWIYEIELQKGFSVFKQKSHIYFAVAYAWLFSQIFEFILGGRALDMIMMYNLKGQQDILVMMLASD